jgi:hypothetical protein
MTTFFITLVNYLNYNCKKKISDICSSDNRCLPCFITEIDKTLDTLTI